MLSGEIKFYNQSIQSTNQSILSGVFGTNTMFHESLLQLLLVTFKLVSQFNSAIFRRHSFTFSPV